MGNKQPNLWAAECITFTAATIFIFLRLFSRRLMRIPLWWDDYLAMACYSMALIWVVLLPIWMSKGLGLHVRDVKGLTVEKAGEITRLLLYIGELVYASALFFGKASILCFYWRMFRVSNIKRPIQILLAASIIWIIIRTFMGIFHCTPVQAFWKSNIPGSRCDIRDDKFFFGTILVHVIIDIAILILPIMQIRKLQLPKLQKIGISLMFGFGIFICVAAMVIIVASTQFDAGSEDITWNLSVIIIWASVEVNLVTVSACLPTVRPAFLYLFTCANPNASLTSGSGTASYGLSQSGAGIKSIRMSNLRKTVDADDSSTYQLADSVKAGSVSDFETHALDRHQRGGGTTQTKIMGSVDMDAHERSMMEGQGGIMVRNETVVRVSDARPRGDY